MRLVDQAHYRSDTQTSIWRSASHGLHLDRRMFCMTELRKAFTWKQQQQCDKEPRMIWLVTVCSPSFIPHSVQFGQCSDKSKILFPPFHHKHTWRSRKVSSAVSHSFLSKLLFTIKVHPSFSFLGSGDFPISHRLRQQLFLHLWNLYALPKYFSLFSHTDKI